MVLTQPQIAALTEQRPLVLQLGALLRRMSEQEYFEFCRAHPDLRIERSSEGELIVMPPAGGGSSRRNFDLAVAFGRWAESDATGISFDSSGGFILPNGAARSPDLAWVRRSRWDALTQEEQERFPLLCPDFVVELRSRTDGLSMLQSKMQEYIENGAQLGWLIDPLERKVYVYRQEAPVECLQAPETLSGEPLLPGFTLDLRRLWL